METIVREAVLRILGSALIRSQVETFIALVLGLLKGEQAGIAAIGRKIPGGAKAKSNMNRVFRFVSNPRIDAGKVCDAVIRALAMRGKTVTVATDWTETGPLSVLASAVVTDGRAIPIYWTVVDDTITRKHSVEVEHMRQLSALLTGVHAIHVLDRGFSRAEFLEQIGGFCSYVIRCKGGFCYIKGGEDVCRQIDDFPIKRGRRHDLGKVSYTKQKDPVHCRLVLFHDHRQTDRWILATNRYDFHRSAVIAAYGTRFRVEESFKDLKDIRNGFALHGYRMTQPDHLSRLLAVVTVGYLIVTSAGHYGEETNLHKGLQVNSREERELAAWRVGLDAIQNNKIATDEVLTRFQQIPLDFVPKLLPELAQPAGGVSLVGDGQLTDREGLQVEAA